MLCGTPLARRFRMANPLSRPIMKMQTTFAMLLSTLALAGTAHAAGNAPIGVPGAHGGPGTTPEDKGFAASGAGASAKGKTPAGKDTEQGAGGMQPRSDTKSNPHPTSPATNGGGGQGF
jgi:hypothetical protein